MTARLLPLLLRLTPPACLCAAAPACFPAGWSWDFVFDWTILKFHRSANSMAAAAQNLALGVDRPLGDPTTLLATNTKGGAHDALDRKLQK